MQNLTFKKLKKYRLYFLLFFFSFFYSPVYAYAGPGVAIAAIIVFLTAFFVTIISTGIKLFLFFKKNLRKVFQTFKIKNYHKKNKAKKKVNRKK